MIIKVGVRVNCKYLQGLMSSLQAGLKKKCLLTSLHMQAKDSSWTRICL